MTNRHGAWRCAGLILIHRFPLSLLFRNRRSLPIPIRGYHLQTLLTLPWLPYTSFLSPSRFSSFPAPIFLPPLPTPLIYAYNMLIRLLYRPVLQYIQLYRLCYLRRRLRCNHNPCLAHGTAVTHDDIVIVSSCYVIATIAPLSC